MASAQVNGVKGWLLAEAVRLHEARQGRCEDAAAVALARSSAGSLSQRLMTRAARLTVGQASGRDLARLGSLLRILAGLTLAMAALAGLATARASVPDEQINVLLAMIVVLAPPTLTLLLWLILMSARRGTTGSGGLIGQALTGALRRIGARFLSGPLARELAEAGAGLMQARLGRWFLASIMHGFWLVFTLVATLTLGLYFSFAQYDLVWGTTILDEDSVVQLVSGLAALPAALGLMGVPEAEWILAARQDTPEIGARAEWASFLMASVLVYGSLPRLLLVLLSAWLAWRARRNLALDTSHPEYLRLAAELEPISLSSRTLGDQPAKPRKRARHKRPNNPSRAVVFGIELERDHDGHPPELPGLAADRIGLADDRAGRQAVRRLVGERRRPPEALIAVCSMLRTPDAGTERFLAGLADTAGAPLILVLDESELLVERGGPLKTRLADWQDLAERVGADCVALDSQQPDASALAHLQQSLRGESVS
ncbi:DUF2868 domain-containing protein [Wenzhouxiangella sp. AB-CW3]|uniref:DUF2868 domain-containing protein n=1 Tax=Wenzhouxiangella sp. AB-CW3 TaxID=2771012 RepID=UPI00168B5EC6|nr:DUF2868 domain-containing protein [Wenzhouxiangella sp. AB-CW3]QOC22262.1 DUF2868 domain-containing protein [Wenzhouxiangella sp. AB-CW3]